MNTAYRKTDYKSLYEAERTEKERVAAELIQVRDANARGKFADAKFVPRPLRTCPRCDWQHCLGTHRSARWRWLAAVIGPRPEQMSYRCHICKFAWRVDV